MYMQWSDWLNVYNYQIYDSYKHQTPHLPAPLITLCPASFISDINECTENMDDCAPANSTCDNTPGSFTCTCDAGYTGNGTVCTGEWVYTM